jgi:Tn3 transposase DDE domain
MGRFEGALRQMLAPIQKIFADTHGYSAWAMGLAKHVGYDLCPRLKSLPDRHLHVPKGNRIDIPESLKEVVLTDISIADIENGWTEFSAVCDAVAAGRISAVLACERFRRGPPSGWPSMLNWPFSPASRRPADKGWHAMLIKCPCGGRCEDRRGRLALRPM